MKVQLLTNYSYKMVESLLMKTSIRMKNKHKVMEKLKRIVTAGPDKLQFICDFDYTLSKFADEKGERCWTTHAVFDHEAARLDPDLGTKLNALRDKYITIEFHPTMTVEEKIPHMKDWWTTAHSLISSSGLSQETLEVFVRDARVYLRDKADQLLRLAESCDIPLVLFSAGIGDLIWIFLKQQLGQVPANLHLISNMMTISDSGDVVGFKEPLIHTFNKNSSVIDGERDFLTQLHDRPNVILLGDSLGDLGMDVGVKQNEETVVKIGFLNFDVERLLPHYLAGYDIVLVQDQTMDVPCRILSSICKQAVH